MESCVSRPRIWKVRGSISRLEPWHSHRCFNAKRSTNRSITVLIRPGSNDARELGLRTSVCPAALRNLKGCVHAPVPPPAIHFKNESLRMSNDKAPDNKRSRLKTGSIGILTTLVYLWLAVLGSGGFAAFFDHPARTILAFASMVMASAAFFSDANLSSGEREDRSNRWIFLPLLVVGLLSSFLPAYTERKELWILDGDIVRWLGVFLYVAGGALRIWPIFVLGRRFSGLVAIQPGHELVTDGIYGVIRHPSYLGLIVMMFGWGLTFRSGAGVILAALIIPPILARIRSEEALLCTQFGDQYDSYRRRTSRLIPGIY